MTHGLCVSRWSSVRDPSTGAEHSRARARHATGGRGITMCRNRQKGREAWRRRCLCSCTTGVMSSDLWLSWVPAATRDPAWIPESHPKPYRCSTLTRERVARPAGSATDSAPRREPRAVQTEASANAAPSARFRRAARDCVAFLGPRPRRSRRRGRALRLHSCEPCARCRTGRPVPVALDCSAPPAGHATCLADSR